MGIARSNNGKPTIPNFENEISIYKDKIIEVCKKFGLDEKKKIQAVVAHELLHANNVCHHGEGDESVEKSHDLLHGLRSGDIYCVMHYDNSGNNRDIDFIPEPLGKGFVQVLPVRDTMHLIMRIPIEKSICILALHLKDAAIVLNKLGYRAEEDNPLPVATGLIQKMS